jgi:hypothetical protein
MHGNVRTWCDDEVPDPIKPGAAKLGVSRGGSYLAGAEACRAGARRLQAHSDQQPSCGLRVARIPVDLLPGSVVDLLPGSVWTGKRTYEKGAYAPATVAYELHIRERENARFKGHVFDNGPGRNFAKVEGEIKGSVIHWREWPGHMPDAVLTMRAEFIDDALRVDFKGSYGNGRFGNEGRGQLKRVSPVQPVH